MPAVNESSISDALLGTKMVGAIAAGTDEIYVRYSFHTFVTPGNFSFTLPDWASAYAVIMSGGGGGGRAGNGGNRAIGYGGKGGKITGLRGWLGTSSDRVLRGSIGAGGAGGASSHAAGNNGGNTVFTAHDGSKYTAEGGTGDPTSGKQDGGTTSTTFSTPFYDFVHLPHGSSYKNGPAGTGNGGAGKFGGGGAGGNGGILNNYTRGGNGGDGCVEISVWGLPPRETVKITLGANEQARDQLLAALTDRGLDYQTVKEIPFRIELVGTGSTQRMFDQYSSLTSAPTLDMSQVTKTYAMFYQCSSLAHVPDMDTSQVTDMDFMFRECSSLTSAPEMDTSQVTTMQQMFSTCSALRSVPDLVTNNVTNMGWMFHKCASLTDGNVRLLGRHPNVTTTNMISSSGLTLEPFYDYDGPTIETVQITLGAGTEARDQFRSALTERGLDYQTITEVPFGIELVGTGSTANMFYGCSKLVSGPDMDTSQVTRMTYMFYDCPSLTSFPDMNTSQVTNMAYMFWNCSSLTSVPDMDTSQVTNMSYMFQTCSSLTDGNVRLIGRHPQLNSMSMTARSGLTREPFYDASGNPI